MLNLVMHKVKALKGYTIFTSKSLLRTESSECHSKPSGSRKCREFIDETSDYQLLKMDSDLWSELKTC